MRKTRPSKLVFNKKTKTRPTARCLVFLSLLAALAACGQKEPYLEPEQERPEEKGGWFSLRPWEINFHERQPQLYRDKVCLAADIWNQQVDSPLFICDPERPVGPRPPATASQLVIYESDNINSAAFSSVWAFTKKDLDVPAYTTLVSEDGVLVEADIYFNNLRYVWDDRTKKVLTQNGKGVWDITSVALHELGHWIFGPNHIRESEDADSVMRAHHTEDIVHASPSQGDKKRLKDLMRGLEDE